MHRDYRGMTPQVVRMSTPACDGRRRRRNVRAITSLLSGLAAFGTMACEPVTSIPATLARGVYCLTADVLVSQGPVFIMDDDATLDCQGHAIRDFTLASASAVVSRAGNIEIRNCVFEGFGRPIWLLGATHFRILDNTFVKTLDEGIYADGDDGLVAGNIFRYAATRESGSSSLGHEVSVAVEIHGTADIVGNSITAATGDGSTWTDRAGIWSEASSGSVIAFNVIRGLVPGPDYWRYGVVAGNSVVYRNTIVAIAPVPYDDVGVSCEYDDRALAVQNVVVGHATPILRCTNPGQTGLKAGGHRR